MIYLACLLFAFSWRADLFLKQKVDLKSHRHKLQIAEESDFSTDHLLKADFDIFHLDDTFFSSFPVLSQWFHHQRDREADFMWIIEASSDCNKVNNSQSYQFRSQIGP